MKFTGVRQEKNVMCNWLTASLLSSPTDGVNTEDFLHTSTDEQELSTLRLLVSTKFANLVQQCSSVVQYTNPPEDTSIRTLVWSGIEEVHCNTTLVFMSRSLSK